MKLRLLLFTVVVLVAAEIALRWSHETGVRGPGESSIAAPLLDPAVLAQAQRIVVREKPQSKTVSNDNGIQVRLVVEADAPIREAVLERRGADRWVVANCLDLDVDAAWLGQTMRDLSQGRLVRYVTSDPKLTDDLQLNLGELRIEDQTGRVLRRLEFGRKDGGDNYQFVRVDSRDVFVAKHTAEIVGSPTAWIVTRLLEFEPADVQELDVTTGPATASSAVFRRAARGAPLLDRAQAAAPAAENVLARLLTEPVMLAIDPQSPEAKAARTRVAAQVRLVLFGGKEYRITYGVLPKSAAPSPTLQGNPVQELAFAVFTCSDPQDLTARYAQKAVLVYNRAPTVDTLPPLATPAALSANVTR